MHRFERCQSTESIWEEPKRGTFFRTTLRSTQQPMRRISWAASLCLPLPVDNYDVYCFHHWCLYRHGRIFKATIFHKQCKHNNCCHLLLDKLHLVWSWWKHHGQMFTWITICGYIQMAAASRKDKTLQQMSHMKTLSENYLLNVLNYVKKYV